MFKPAQLIKVVNHKFWQDTLLITDAFLHKTKTYF